MQVLNLKQTIIVFVNENYLILRRINYYRITINYPYYAAKLVIYLLPHK